MNKFASLLAIALLLANSSTWAEADSSTDLRYCLDLKTNDEIAKCAGEISPGEKGKAFSKEKVEEILSKEKTGAPVSANDASGTPASASDKPAKDLLLEKTGNNGK